MELEKAEKYIFRKLKKELPKYLYYHSIGHVKDVLNAAVNLAKVEKISETDFQLLKIAVLLHDSGFTITVKNHEKSGCHIAKEILPQFGFTQNQIKKICGMIMATKIPQTPHNQLEEIICDADLDYLGRNDYDTISQQLYMEINIKKTLDQIGWLKMQISFLEKHQYFTATAIKMRTRKKSKTLEKLKKEFLKIKIKKAIKPINQNGSTKAP